MLSLRRARRRQRDGRAGDPHRVKLLIDNCLSPIVAAKLRELGHDVEWVGDWTADPGDDEILALAHQRGRVLITFAKGFGGLMVLKRQPHGGVIRISRTPAREHAALCIRAVEQHAEALLAGAMIVATTSRIRVRWPAGDA